MAIENECRKLNIHISDMCMNCKKLGCDYIGAYIQRRFVYDFNPIQKGRWIRLRSNGDKSTLTIKEIKSLRIDGTKELEIEVSDFDIANEILNKLGYTARAYQENFRIEYKLGDITFDIDKWPGIPAYVEIEGKQKNDVLNAIHLLGWSEQDMTFLDTERIYNEIYGINLDAIPYLRFTQEENEDLKLFLSEG